MKKLLATLAIVGAVIASGVVYPDTMEIVGIDEESDTVTLATATGYVYQMTGTEDYIEGDLVSLIMYSNGTKSVLDDEILAARFSGYTVR